MPSLFASLEQAAGETVDSVFAEAFLLQPRAKAGGDVNARAGNAGPAVPFRGIFSCNGQAITAKTRGRVEDTDTTALIAAPPFVDAFASAFPERPQVGWHVTRAETGERFRIAEVMDREGGRLILALTRQQ
ncbi:hypothetical protein [Microvirga arsenatis]|uniref:Uncharacterized protein n=1 Tax=Microvirga arsenatis TaxID=2692265 RepID=A0ABW9YY91_9HYPH|nr:hypothetical protein [Microvirga arsenatis]NBJ13207.1 hypothetical protein [Microvirga arsenatis]NBJ25155.1 hypothetical protein [Microvirga arsenatis]